MVISTAAMVFAVGTFIKIMPRLEQPSMSQLSTPTPARTIAFSLVPAPRNFSSTAVELLVIATSASPKIPYNSLLGTLVASITLTSDSCLSRSKPILWIASQTMIVFIKLTFRSGSARRGCLAGGIIYLVDL